MPSVSSPSDGSYKYYQRTVSELEDELQKEAKRARERSEEHARKLEEDYQREIGKRERQLDDTVKDIKENTDRYIASDRETSKAEMERLKNTTYDRNGRSNVEVGTLRRQIEDQNQSIQEIEARNRLRANETEQDYHSKMEDLRRSAREENEQALTEARKAANHVDGKTAAERDAEYEDFKKDTEARYRDLDRTRLNDLNLQRRQTDQSMDEIRRDYEHRMKGVEKSAERLVEGGRENNSRRMEQDTRRLNESHAKSTSDLRDQIKTLVDSERTPIKERAQGTQQAVKDYEDGWRDRQKLMSDSYQREIGELKDQAKRSDVYFNHLNSETLREKDAYFANLLKRQGLDEHERQKELESTFSKEREGLEKRVVQERRQNKLTRDADLKESDKQREVALETQAKAYQDTIQRERAAERQQMARLEKQLSEKQNSKDISNISPAVETAVRKSIVGEYDKQFQAERERHARSEQSIQGDYANRLKDTVVQGETERANMARTHAGERSFDRAQFLEHISDTEFMKNEALRSREVQHQRQTETVDRNHSSLVERQRREYEEMLQIQRDDASARILAVRQELEFNSKMAQRAFTARQNEIIRDYDKKLADQKQEYEARLDDLRVQDQQLIREGERKNKLTLDEQQRIYEQRIAQLESQHKERERYITQNYQEDLEKVKRSNALLIQKKS